MHIKSALELADKHSKDTHMTVEVWALRVLAGAYRREKEISKRLRTQAKEAYAEGNADA
jgi:hypothetical protein